MKTFLNIFKYWGLGLLVLASLVVLFGLAIGAVGLLIFLVSSKSIINWVIFVLIIGGIFGTIAYNDDKKSGMIK